MSRRPINDPLLSWLKSKGNILKPVRYQVYPQKLCRYVRYRQSEQHGADNRQDCCNSGGDEKKTNLFDIIKYNPSFFNRIKDTGEIVIRNNHVGSFLCHVCSGPAHCYAYMSSL